MGLARLHGVQVYGSVGSDTMERSGLFYVRFMDDILVLAQSRWAIRRAMRTVTHWLNALRLDKHPDKTFIGRIARGFDFLGYHFWPDRLTVAAKTVQAFQDKVSRLYEQNGGSVGVPAAVETYVRRWNAWAKGWARLCCRALCGSSTRGRCGGGGSC